MFKDCDYKTPMIFVLSAGSDPLEAIQTFANSKKKKLMPISLGQGRLMNLGWLKFRSRGSSEKGYLESQELGRVDSTTKLPLVQNFYARAGSYY